MVWEESWHQRTDVFAEQRVSYVGRFDQVRGEPRHHVDAAGLYRDRHRHAAVWTDALVLVVNADI